MKPKKVELIKYSGGNQGTLYRVNRTWNTTRPVIDEDLTEKQVDELINKNILVIIKASKYQFTPA